VKQEVHVGLLDDALGKAVPGGSISKPLMIALGALLVGKMMSGGSSDEKSEPTLVPKPDANAGSTDGGLLGGIGGLVEKLQKAGQGEAANSWVGNGPNKPIDPGSLAKALGPQNVNQAAQQAGINAQDLVTELAQNLPGIIDKLTANGKIPTLQELATVLTQNSQAGKPGQ
jgi:uncharacterized protein YidB (DUF937 family)